MSDLTKGDKVTWVANTTAEPDTLDCSGLTGRIIETFPPTHAGFDCTVAVAAADVAARLLRQFPKEYATMEAARDYVADYLPPVAPDGDEVILEANRERELAPAADADPVRVLANLVAAQQASMRAAARALRLVLAMNDNPRKQDAAYPVRLDPKAAEQVRAALRQLPV